MDEIIKEELQRFGKVFFSYTKIVWGGMFLATLFFFFYAGIRANYLSIEILTATFSTLSTCVLAICFFFLIINRKKKERTERDFKKVQLALKVISLGRNTSEIKLEAPKHKTSELDSVSIVKINKAQDKIAAYEYSLIRGLLFSMFVIEMVWFIFSSLDIVATRTKKNVQEHIEQ